jgi:phosphonate transport system substrate-binding protein
VKRFLATFLATVLAATMYVGFAQGEVPDRLVLGMVPSREADVIVDSLGPIADMLSERLLIPVETFVSTNYTGLVEALGTGRVDIGFFPPAGVVEAVDVHGAEVILASVRQGSTTYRAQFNVRCDSGITEFEQFRGRSIAWTDPGSSSGFRFPYVTLRSTYGIDPDTEMTQIFAGSHDAAMLAVYNGDVDVALTFGGSPGSDGRTTIQNDYPDVFDVICIVGFSDDIPNDGTVVRAGLDPELADQIAQALIDIADTEEGRVHTEAMFNVTAFARVESSAYDIVREVNRTFQR